MDLSAREEKFCQRWVATRNYAQSARYAGYKGAKLTGVGLRLMKRERVQQRIQQIQQAVAGELEMSAKQVIGMIVECGKEAQSAGDHSTRMRGLIRLLDYYTETNTKGEAEVPAASANDNAAMQEEARHTAASIAALIQGRKKKH